MPVESVPVRRFAFLLHPVRSEYFYKVLPPLRRLPETWVERAFALLPPFKLSHITGIESATGARAEGWFIVLPMTPRELFRRPWPQVRERLIRAGRIAERLGAQILGLGAFTKIVGDRGVSVNEALSIPVTTGNSYTAATAVEASLLAAERLGIAPREAAAAVIGATGSIGAACAQLLAPEVGRLLLVARGRERLEQLRERLQGLGAQVEVSTDPRAAAGQAELVITVSSATDVLLQPEDLLPGAVVCDVARPRNVSAAVYERRDDVLVIDGGVVEVPGPRVDFGFDFGFPPGTAEACIAETIILALEGRLEPFTLGAEVSVEKVREIHALGRKHGFRLAGFRRFERRISDDEVERIRERAAARRRAGVAVR